jgi:hypothetical protein
MSDDKKPKNPMMELLARKKAMQANNKGQFNPNNGKQGKPSKGFGGPAVTRKTGRGS